MTAELKLWHSPWCRRRGTLVQLDGLVRCGECGSSTKVGDQPDDDDGDEAA